MNENSRFSFHSRAPDETARSAEVLAEVLAQRVGPSEGACVVSLVGELGAGKTHFVKGLATGLGLDADLVTSPTFAIVNEYESEGGPQLIHLDFYRLESEMALEEVGFLDLLALPAVLAIEWGNRFSRSLPTDHIRVEIEHEVSSAEQIAKSSDSPGNANGLFETEEASPRTLRVTATGARSQAVLDAWRDALAGSI